MINFGQKRNVRSLYFGRLMNDSRWMYTVVSNKKTQLVEAAWLTAASQFFYGLSILVMIKNKLELNHCLCIMPRPICIESTQIYSRGFFLTAFHVGVQCLFVSRTPPLLRGKILPAYEKTHGHHFDSWSLGRYVVTMAIIHGKLKIIN